MGDLQTRFPKLVFAQVLLGVIAFCIAERNPGLLLLAGAFCVLSQYVAEGPNGRPLPRWALNAGSLVAVAWLLIDLRMNANVVLAMGHFTMWLQVLLLYARKTNRDHAQILVLSLLLMIGASILSVSMLYGALLAAYCVLGLVTVLHFQMKSAADQVAERSRLAMGATEAAGDPTPLKPVIGRGYRWHLRLTTAGVGVGCAAIAVVVFVLTPRQDSRLPDEEAASLARREVGFNQQVRLAAPPAGEGRKEPVLNLRVSLHGSDVGHDGRPWLLRGAALDEYNTETHTWTRSAEAAAFDQTLRLDADGVGLIRIDDAPMLEATLTLRQVGYQTLFSMHPPVAISSDHLERVIYNPLDEQLASGENIPGAVVYTIRAPLNAPSDLTDRYLFEPIPLVQRYPRWPRRDVPPAIDPDDYARGWSIQRGRILALVQQILKKHGLSRDPSLRHSPNDERIATVLMHFLRDQFSYSLDNPPVREREEPVIEFLFNHRRGHCELFASALAAMTRSIGMPARVITGYRASEYNRIGGYYVVRQSNAHAWTEVHCGPGEGWKTFDATPPLAVNNEHRVARTRLTGLRELYEHLEFEWLRAVVAYDRSTRAAVMNELRDRVGLDSGTSWSAWVDRGVRELDALAVRWRFHGLQIGLAVAVVLVLGAAVIGLLRLHLIRRRRLAALQLRKAPPDRRRALARRLRFYLVMLDLLERHGYQRPAWQSPYAFAHELAEANPMRFDPVLALTELFYQVRFGYHELDEERERAARTHLRRLEENLVSH